jgi:ribonuclease BN (tRNA processing enzyme)
MDFGTKGSPSYDDAESRRIVDSGEGGDCSKIAPARRVRRPLSNHPFAGATGISITGTQTNIALPNLDITIDAGANVEKVLERNLLVSHFDADHIEGIGRAICNAINTKQPLDIVMPSMDNRPAFREAIDTFAKQDKDDLVSIHEVKGGDSVDLQKDTRVEAFKVSHSPESVGYLVWKKNRVGKWDQKLTYTGDLAPSGIEIAEPRIKNSEALVMEASMSGSFLPLFQPIANLFTKHASSSDVQRIAKKSREIKDIGIIHVMPGILCWDIKNDLKAKLSGLGKHVYLFESCSKELLDDPGSRMAGFERVI